MTWLAAIADDIERHGAVVRVTVIRADGSTPREVGAAMSVSTGTLRGTIGGGALELAAIAHARSLLATDGPAASPALSLHDDAAGVGSVPAPHHAAGGQVGAARWERHVRDFPLGPSLGQCCGGFARLLLEVLAAPERAELIAMAAGSDPARALLLRPLTGAIPPRIAADRREHRPEWPLAVTRAVRDALSGARPRAAMLVRGGKGEPAWFVEPVARPLHHLYLYGAGHVGRAIVRVVEGLPFAVTWVDTAADRFPATIPPHARAEITRDPAAFTSGTEADAFHLVLTYSHALDLAICDGLLRCGDFRFLGLIGSTTKRARFLRRLAELGIGPDRLMRLTCPIGLPGVGGKEPAMIALSVAAQLLQLATAAETRRPASGLMETAR